ncbi:MAG: Adenylate cyclase [Alphaproteobacteria bacterium MarineAlpha3_Bin5]|nr:hypothetical protein [Magnetovibrio sp.]PPR76954.1 MAG: Adenylate cyclase [Alphaproteobacteria bacterium MarineAlpha3_Bin5]
MAYSIPIPKDEEERLKNLKEYDILDTAPEMIFDELTELAAEILQCPVATIQFLSEDRQWFKSKYGLPDDLVETPRDMAICSHTICQNDLLLVPDLTKDERFSNNTLVTQEPNMRFYAGMPLVTPKGHSIGTFCTLDFEVREISLNQQEALRRLSNQVITQLELRRTIIEMNAAINSRDKMHEDLLAEKKRSDELLLNILPARIANELTETEKVEPRFYKSASIMFSDFAGFTKLSEQMEPKSLIELLNQYFCVFDNIISSHDLEKLKTIGDSYMCVSGVPVESRGHAIRICLAALEIQSYMVRANEQREKMRMPRWDMRIGIHTGPVIAGVVGQQKFTYDIWGDAVNTAALMEQKSDPGKINISSTTFQHVNDVFEIEERGKINSGKKGDLPMYFLSRLSAKFSKDQLGLKPNEIFDQKYGHLMKIYGS